MRGLTELYGDTEDFKQYYARPSMANHGNCESIIRQDSIACARAKPGSVLVGFSQIVKNQLTMMAPYDIGSSNDTFSSYNYHVLPGSKDAQYRVPDQMVNHTRHAHNEMVNDRYYTDENGKLQKIKPDFVVWIEEDLSHEYCEIGEETKRLAAELDIPIVRINRERMAQRESGRVEVLNKLIAGEEVTNPEYKQYVEEYKDLSVPELIQEVVVKYGNNRTGMQYSPSIQDKYFTNEQFKETMSIIENRISTMDGKLKNECVEALKNVCEKEFKESLGEHDMEETKEYWREWDKYMTECYEKYLQQYKNLADIESQGNGVNDKQKKKALMQQYLDEEIDVSMVKNEADKIKKAMTKEQDDRSSTAYKGR